jgi:transposase InsO family protein
MHDNLSHFGVDRTYASLILRYWWRGCYADTLDYVRKCLICQTAKRDVHSHHAKLRPIEVEGAFDTVHVDFLSLPETPEGYRYLILFVDSFSRWPEAFATKTQDMTVVADKLYSEIVCRYGAMRRLISDMGASLRSKLVEELCKRMNIKRTYTTAFRPQTNSHCERTNSGLINLLKTHISEQSDWPRFLPAVLGAIRSTVNTRSSKFSPHYLLFSREMRLPLDVSLNTPETCTRMAGNYIKDLNDTLRVAAEVAKENIADA